MKHSQSWVFNKRGEIKKGRMKNKEFELPANTRKRERKKEKKRKKSIRRKERKKEFTI